MTPHLLLQRRMTVTAGGEHSSVFIEFVAAQHELERERLDRNLNRLSHFQSGVTVPLVALGAVATVWAGDEGSMGSYHWVLLVGSALLLVSAMVVSAWGASRAGVAGMSAADMRQWVQGGHSVAPDATVQSFLLEHTLSAVAGQETINAKLRSVWVVASILQIAGLVGSVVLLLVAMV